MTIKLSTKGQVVLPKRVRQSLQLRPGSILGCRIEGGSIVLTPEGPVPAPSRSIRDAKTGLRITRSPAHVKVTSGDVRAALLDFP